MKQIRVGVFETNSSSTHSLTIVPEEDYEKWVAGELLFDRSKEVLVPLPEGYKEKEESGDWEDDDLQTFDAYNQNEKEDFVQKFTTKSGDKIVAFGQYGYDG